MQKREIGKQKSLSPPMVKDSLEEIIGIDHVTKVYHSQKNDKKQFTVLDDISFSISHGERVGIIGANGAGKSTLLNIISGFTKQTSGTVKVNGTISAILDMGVGTQEELSGRKNLYESGKLRGLEGNHLTEKVEEIIAFTDISRYIDMPVKTYSSGMKARLAFGQLAFIQPEILIIDEVLGVGDAEFVEKSNKKLVELCNQGKLLIMVSHDMHALQNFTSRCLWIDHGKLIMDGPTPEVTNAYSQSVRVREEAKMQERLAAREQFNNQANGAKISSLTMHSKDNKETRTIFDLFDDITITIRILADKVLSDLKVNLDIELEDATLLSRNTLSGKAMPSVKENQPMQLDVCMNNCRLAQGIYTLVCHVISQEEQVASRTTTFEIVNNKVRYYNTSLYFPEYTMEIKKKTTGGDSVS